jgi:hypothetical protein
MHSDMQPGLIVLEDETTVPIRFRISRKGDSGRVRARQSGDFSTLMRLYREDETVLLRNLRGTWQAHVHIWEPDTITDDRSASFQFTVEGKIESE